MTAAIPIPASAQRFVDERGHITTAWLRLLEKIGTTSTAGSIFVSVTDYGAVGDGITDDAPSINAALSSAPAGSIVVAPPAVYYCGSTINVPFGIMLMGLSIARDSVGALGSLGQLGTTFLFPASVGTCVSLNGGPASAAVGLKQCTIIRTPLSPIPAGSVGVLVASADQPLIEDVYVVAQETGVKLDTITNITSTTNINRLCTTQISGSHLWLNNAVETHLLACRFGKNGGFDVNGSQYIRISGTTDSILATCCNFNLSANNISQAILVDNLTSQNGPFDFVGCHFEGIGNFMSQVGSSAITRLTLVGTSVNMTGMMFDGTIGSGFLQQFQIVGNSFILPSMTLTAPGLLNISASSFTAAVSIIGGSGNVRANFNNSLSLAGAFTGMMVDAAMTGGGTLTNTGTGQLFLNQANSLSAKDWRQDFAPAITFGGGSTGIAYSTQVGHATRFGDFIYATGTITLTSKGSSTGAASITGLPFRSNNSNRGQSTPSLFFSNLTFTGQAMGIMGGNATEIGLYYQTELGALSAMSEVNFANNTTIIFAILYYSAP